MAISLTALAGQPAQFAYDAAGNLAGISTGDSIAPLPIQSGYCFFHGYAPICVDDNAFRDMSGSGNNGNLGAHLSRAQAWATNGYVSTVDPATGATDSVIRIPSLNFDYAGGEKLILWWLGQATPEGADENLMGDAASATAGAGGLRFRAKSTGKVDLVAYGAGSLSQFTAASTASVFDGTLHSFAYAIDGSTKKYGLWVDEVLDPALAAAYGTFAGNVALDTKTSNTFNIGGCLAAPGNLSGMATKTRALVIIRMPASATMPPVAAVTTALRALRSAPHRGLSRITA